LEVFAPHAIGEMASPSPVSARRARRPVQAGDAQSADKLHLLSVFVGVVDSGGLAGAARSLGLSPSTVTRAILKLERHLGARLLTRTTRAVRLTEAGARYVRDCREILAALSAADAMAHEIHGDVRGRLSLTAPALFGARFVTPIVTEYLERYAEMNASCAFVDHVVDLMAEDIDVAVRIGALEDSSMQAIRVGSVRRLVCAAPSYLARRGTPQSPAELQHHCIISAATVTPTRDWRFGPGPEALVVKVKPRLTTTTNDSAIQAAIQGFGLTRQLSYQVSEALDDGRLVRVLEGFEPAPSPVHLLHREGRHASRKTRAFLDLAIERLRGHPLLR
jgi:DNA-binding transcriptional LysR family regulator